MIDLEKVRQGFYQCMLDNSDDEYETQCMDCPYFSEFVTVQECKKELRDDFAAMIREQDPVKPVKTCKTLSTMGVDGILIVGTCPVCGQYWLNNRDNKFCGGCGRRLIWNA